MLRKPSSRRPWAATALLALLAFLPLASPAAGEGLPAIGPDQLFSDCYGSGDAGNSFETARQVWADELSCGGFLLPQADEADWYRFWLGEGQTLSAATFTYLPTSDVDLCLYAPEATLLGCSKLPLLTNYDYVFIAAETTGEYRAEVLLATGGGPYSFSLYASSPPPPPPFPDVAIVDLQVSKAVLGTDLGSTGVVNPVGAWKLTARIANVGSVFLCVEDLYFYASAPSTVQPFFYGPYWSTTAYVDCLEAGQETEVSVYWRPVGFVGDVAIGAQAYVDYDANWADNEREVSTFVLAQGV